MSKLLNIRIISEFLENLSRNYHLIYVKNISFLDKPNLKFDTVETDWRESTKDVF